MFKGASNSGKGIQWQTSGQFWIEATSIQSPSGACTTEPYHALVSLSGKKNLTFQ
jgi:hypothetical protein